MLREEASLECISPCWEPQPTALTAASPVDRMIPATQPASIETASHGHPAVLGAGYDVDVAQTSIKLAESALLPQVSVQGSVSRQVENDPTLSVRKEDQASVVGQMHRRGRVKDRRTPCDAW